MRNADMMLTPQRIDVEFIGLLELEEVIMMDMIE